MRTSDRVISPTTNTTMRRPRIAAPLEGPARPDSLHTEHGRSTLAGQQQERFVALCSDAREARTGKVNESLNKFRRLHDPFFQAALRGNL